MLHTITAPIYIVLPRKTIKDKRIPLSLNWYRNAHYITSNDVKKIYKEILKPQILKLPKLSVIEIWFDYYSKTKQRSDLGNWVSVSEKFALDALVELGKLKDDSMRFVPRTHSTFCGTDPDKQGKMIITIKEIP